MALLNQQCSAPLNFKSYLDIGCGDGRLLSQLSQQNPNAKCLGIDLSDSLIEKANLSATGNLTFQSLDARALEVLPQSYHFISSFFCLQWLNQQEIRTVFELALEKLAKDGELLLLLPIDQQVLCDARSRALDAFFSGHTIPFGVTEADIYKALFTLNDEQAEQFEVLLCGEQYFPFDAMDEVFSQYIGGWISELRDLPFSDAQRDAYLAKVVSLMPRKSAELVDFSTRGFCVHIRRT
ncbi:hypothetical protein CS022_14480 [Veronia nyctiphanis]|uniref:Methyltransferase domain-containing protein n=2 Tax=Veronia nyctiphanis TaxID=1278244 RepID=A0A4Q0YNX0_9GAMM|nr:hypothetical protein CS022_14480 [Veronia nyctiphanis]